jgi:hypothetical protein
MSTKADTGTPGQNGQKRWEAADRPRAWSDRSSPRYTSLEFRAWIAWWKNDSELATGSVRLMDIGPGGAMVEAPERRPIGEYVLLTLEGLSPYDAGVEAIVVQTRPVSRGNHRLHLAFTEPCPESLLHAAIEGIRPKSPPGPPESP